MWLSSADRHSVPLGTAVPRLPRYHCSVSCRPAAKRLSHAWPFVFTRKDKMLQHVPCYRFLLPTATAFGLRDRVLSARLQGRVRHWRSIDAATAHRDICCPASAFTSRRCRGMVSLQSAQAGSIGL